MLLQIRNGYYYQFLLFYLYSVCFFCEQQNRIFKEKIIYVIIILIVNDKTYIGDEKVAIVHSLSAF